MISVAMINAMTKSKGRKGFAWHLGYSPSWRTVRKLGRPELKQTEMVEDDVY